MTRIAGSCAPGFEGVRDAFARNFEKDDLGAGCAVTRGGEVVVDLWGGHRDPARRQPWERDTLVNVWSTTKMVTALCVLVLHERGALSVDAPVADYWPDFAANGKEGVLVRHVLGHTAGLPVFEEPVDDLAVRRAKRRAEAKLRDMLRYARSVTCRRHFLLTYFGENSPERCGHCDICLGRHRAVVITPDDEPVMRHILHQIENDVPRHAWFDEQPVPDHHVDGLIDYLVQEGFLYVEAPLEEIFSITEKAATMMEQWKPRKG